MDNPRPKLFAELKALATNLEDRVRELTLQNVPSVKDEYAADKAEEMLEEVQAMTKEEREVKTGLSDLEAFVENSVQQLNDLKEDVVKAEKWAVQYGYKPQWDLEEWEDYLERKLKEDDLKDDRGPSSPDRAPSILMSGLSQDCLRQMGYRFKGDRARGQTLTSAVPEPIPEQHSPVPKIKIDSPAKAPEYKRTVSMSSDDETSPMPIIKRPTAPNPPPR